jgi:hypothetical protein
MAVKPYFDFSVSYDVGDRVLPAPRSATPAEKAARKAADYLAAAPGREARAAAYAAQQAQKEKAKEQVRKHGKKIVWDGSSECFDDLVYDLAAGGVYATFSGPAAGTWFYPMSRADAKEWLVDFADVTGEFFNASGIRADGE